MDGLQNTTALHDHLMPARTAHLATPQADGWAEPQLPTMPLSEAVRRVRRLQAIKQRRATDGWGRAKVLDALDDASQVGELPVELRASLAGQAARIEASDALDAEALTLALAALTTMQTGGGR